LIGGRKSGRDCRGGVWSSKNHQKVNSGGGVTNHPPTCGNRGKKALSLSKKDGRLWGERTPIKDGGQTTNQKKRVLFPI